jgi:hypothetical protein
MSFEQWQKENASQRGFEAWQQDNAGMSPLAPIEQAALAKMRGDGWQADIVFDELRDQPNQIDWPGPTTSVGDLWSNVGSMGGGLGGSALGYALGNVPGAIAGGFLGDLAGGTGGELFRQATEDPNMNVVDALRVGRREATLGLAGQFGGDLLGRAIKGGWIKADKIPGVARLTQKLKRAATRIKDVPETLAMPERARRIAQKGGYFSTAAQQTENPITDTLESIAESSYGGGKNIYQLKRVIGPRAFQQVANETATDFWQEAGRVYGADEVAEMLVRSYDEGMDQLRRRFSQSLTRGLDAVPQEQLRKTIGESLETTRQAYRAAGNARYRAVDNLITQGATTRTDIVPRKPLLNLANQLEAEVAQSGNIGSAKAVRRIAKELRKGDPFLTLQEADRLRSDLGDELRKQLPRFGPKSKVAKDLIRAQKVVGEAMDAATQHLPGNITGAYSEAREFWRVYRELYDTPFVKQLSKVSDTGTTQNMARVMFVKGAPERAILAKRVVGRDTFNTVRDTWLQNAVDESLKDPRSIGGALQRRLDKMGPETLDAMFGKQQREELYGLAAAFAKEGKRGWEDRMLRSAVQAAEGNPKALARRLIDPKNVSRVRLLKRNTSPRTFAAIRALYVQDLLERKAGEGGRNLLGETVSAFGKELRELGAAKHALFTPKHLNDLYDISQMAVLLGRPTGGGGGILAPLMEAGAVAGLIVRPTKSAAGAVPVLGGFKLLSMVFGNERATHFVVEGIKHPKLARLFAQRAIAEVVKSTGRGVWPSPRERRQQEARQRQQRMDIIRARGLTR